MWIIDKHKIKSIIMQYHQTTLLFAIILSGGLIMIFVLLQGVTLNWWGVV